jgi:hypothetical protein
VTRAGHERSLSELFAEFADSAVRHLPLYRRLCEGAAADPEVADRLLLSPHPEQRIPNLLLAAVHDVVLSGDHDPEAAALAQWYRSVTDAPRRLGRDADDPWPHFRALALESEGVAERLRTRSTQTNEVGRCATLLPALMGVAADGRHLGLVEVGASAGLNLLLDRYGYAYRGASGTVGHGDHGTDAVTITPDSPLVLHCALRGPHRPVLHGPVPTIASRVGLDRSPIDVADPAQGRWLVACQWPDQPDRVHRARTAIAMSHGRRPRICTGDAVDDLPALVAEVAEPVMPVVISTWVLNYLSAERQQAFVDRLDEIGAERDISLICSEQPGAVPGLRAAGVVPGRPDGGPDGPATALVRVDWLGGRRTATRLADQHPHGTWMEWLGPT